MSLRNLLMTMIIGEVFGAFNCVPDFHDDPQYIDLYEIHMVHLK